MTELALFDLPALVEPGPAERSTYAAGYLTGLKHAACTLQDYRQHAITERGTIPSGTQRAWWFAWDSLCRRIDVMECPTCNDAGLVYPDHKPTDCTHPGQPLWATRPEDHNRPPVVVELPGLPS